MTGNEAHCRRREFLQGAALGGAAGLVGLRPTRALAEPPPETTKIRLFKFPGICLAPQYIAEDLLRTEGFTDVEYVEFKEAPANVYDRVASGLVDLTQWYGAPFIV
jgi:NitT/TauT family transport system substrate-binding protein